MTRIEISIEAEDEDMTPEQAGRGAEDGYAEAVREVKKRAAGKWGWCNAKITARIMRGNNVLGEGDAYLGNCSYESAVDFTTSGYLPQMIEEAIEDAAKSMKRDGEKALAQLNKEALVEKGNS